MKSMRDESYEFQEVKISVFNNKYLNGTVKSVVSECKFIDVPSDISEAAEGLKPRMKETKRVKGRIVGVDVVVSLVCISCKKHMEEIDSADRFMECQSCKTSLLKEFLKPAVSANLILVDESDESVGLFHCPGSVLNAVFELLKGNECYNIEESDVTKVSCKLITETLLLLKKASFKLLMDDMKVASIDIL